MSSRERVHGNQNDVQYVFREILWDACICRYTFIIKYHSNGESFVPLLYLPFFGINIPDVASATF